MKLITLNIWGGIVFKPLIEFIEKHSEKADIFCFQEVLFGDKSEFTPLDKARQNIFNEITVVLPEFVPYKFFSNSKHFQFENIDFPAGQAIFVKNSLKVKDSGNLRCYKEIPTNSDRGGNITGNLAWLDMEISGEVITIANLHGLWQEGTQKADTPERILQSKIIKDFLNSKQNKKILCGDFNLAPNCDSMNILEQGMVNMIKQYNITSTRSKHYRKYSQKGASQFADYILTSPDIQINNFIVFQDDVSDHLPLSLDFN